MAHVFNLNTWKAEAGGPLSSRPASPIYRERVPGQPRIHRKTPWELRRQLSAIKEKGFLSRKPTAASGDQHGSLKPVLYKEIDKRAVSSPLTQ